VAPGLGAINSRMAARSKGGLTGPRNGLGRPAWAHFDPANGLLCLVSVPESSRVFPDLHVGPCRQFLFRLDEAPCLARFNSFLMGSSEFVIFSGLVLGLSESCLLHCLTCAELSDLVMRCLMNLSRKSCFQY
jgi:hypothetical protein